MARDSLFRFWPVMLVLVCLIVAGCGGGLPANKAKEAPRVTVARPEIRTLVDEDDYNGWLEAYKTVDVRARVRGHITKVCFQDGDIVKVGQPLFEIDSAPFEAELKQAEAQARAFEAEKVAALRELERGKSLAKKEAISQSDLDKLEAEAASLDAQCAAKNAEAERYRLDVKYSKVTADLSGKIGKAALIEGDLVNAGGTDPLLTTIVAIDPVYVDFNVDERAMQRYQETGVGRAEKDKQQPLREKNLAFSFGLDTEQGFPHQGLLVFADNKYTPGTGTIPVRGVAQNPDGRLIPGSRVRVRVPVSEKYQAAVIPDSAVLSDQDRRYLLVLGKENVVLRRDITPGRLLDDGMRVVLPAPGEEKAAGDNQWARDWENVWVITLGLQRARIDYPVQPLDASGQPIGTAGATR